MNIRTVFDTRTNTRTAKYRTTILLLAASWHKYLRKDTKLEIKYIGQLPTKYQHFFEDLGIKYSKVFPNINSEYAKTTNCIEAATPSNKRLLLVDNDIVFMDELSALKNIKEDHIAACYTGTLWISNKQWDIIQNKLELPILRTDANIIPLKEQFKLQQNPNYKVAQSDIVYVNAGVLVIPPILNLKPIWERDVKLIADYFKTHPLKSHGVYTSCQAGLATAIGAYKNFSWLPIDYNYLSICFVLGLKNEEEIKILHLGGDVGENAGISSLNWVEQFWQERMYDRLEVLKNIITEGEFNRRISTIDKVKKKVLNLMNEYNLHF